MPVGAIVGAVATVGGAVLGASAQKSAGKDAAAAQDRATEAELQMARENAQLYKDVDARNLNVLGPYNQLGYEGARARNALLGLGAGPAYSPPQTIDAIRAAGDPDPAAALAFLQPLVGRKSWKQANKTFAKNPNMTGEAKISHILTDFAKPEEIETYNKWRATHPATAANTPGSTTPATTPDQDYNAAYDKYLNSTGYKFQVNQGLEGLAFAKRLSGIDSGDMAKSATNYNREMGRAFFGDYMGLLGQQQNMGVGAAGAIAGQGNAMANGVAGANTAAGNAVANGQIALGNMALAKGQNQANMWGGIASGVGNAIGQIWAPSSYRSPYGGYGSSAVQGLAGSY